MSQALLFSSIRRSARYRRYKVYLSHIISPDIAGYFCKWSI